MVYDGRSAPAYRHEPYQTGPIMSQYDFDELLQKYLAGACDPAEERLILDWYQTMITQSTVPVDAREKEAIRQRVWRKLAGSTIGSPKHRLQTALYWYPFAVAACVAFLLAFAGVWLSHSGLRTAITQPLTQPPYRENIEIRNSSRSPQVITLEDGTLITLKPTGVLSCPAHFGRQNRTVYLKGDAFFQVKKDPAKPFIVHTGDLITEVLGTSFTIKSYEGAKDIEVSVLTGRVSVYQAADRAIRNRKEVILKPNEQIAYTTQSRQLIPRLVEDPVQVTPRSQPISLIFDDTPLPDVLDRLQVVYGIDIFLESDVLSTCMLNADLNELTLFSQLELICKSMNAAYEVRGTSIFVKGLGKGCQ